MLGEPFARDFAQYKIIRNVNLLLVTSLYTSEKKQILNLGVCQGIVFREGVVEQVTHFLPTGKYK